MAIADGKDNKLDASIANKLLDRRRLKIKQVVDEIRAYFPNVEIDSFDFDNDKNKEWIS